MNCDEIKKIIPRYFQHTAGEEEMKKVEEHLCVCHDCRLALGELMDKLTEFGSPEDKTEDIKIVSHEGEGSPHEEGSETNPQEVEELFEGDEISEKLKSLADDKEKVEYFPGQEAEAPRGKKGLSEEKEPEGVDISSDRVEAADTVSDFKGSEPKVNADESSASLAGEEIEEPPAQETEVSQGKKLEDSTDQKQEKLPEESIEPVRGKKSGRLFFQNHQIGAFECFVLAIGVGAFIFFIYLVLSSRF